jgi:nucleoside 2-deoxyribosyltransferase
LAWLSASDAVVAEVTTPSLGVGYELGIAEKLNKPVLCLYENTIKDRKLSAMISGNPKFRTFHYKDLDQAKKEIVSFIESIS